jgi:hypothetical protein
MFRLITRIAISAALVLSIIALVMAVLLFQQRETLKGRAQKLESAIHKIAATIENEGATNVMFSIPDDQLKTFKSKPGGPPAMDEPLNRLITAAQSQLVCLNNTRSELADTKLTLAKTQDELKNTKLELAAANAKIKEQEGVIAEKNNIISEKEVAIGKLERQKSELITTADAMKARLEEMEVENQDLTDQVSVLEDKIGILQVKAFPELQQKIIPKGRQGVVAYVNPEWNFLILRLTPESIKTAAPDLELMVYRMDKLVGKVRLASIANDLAVAEIINDWQQTIPQNGDGILY